MPFLEYMEKITCAVIFSALVHWCYLFWFQIPLFANVRWLGRVVYQSRVLFVCAGGPFTSL